MKAVQFTAFGGPVAVTTVPDPAPSSRGVVIRVEATGLCRSDWHGWQGHDPDITLPHVPGHELAGTVVACGPEVRRSWMGKRVTLPFVCGCGSCPECAGGHQQVCEYQFQPGFTAWGSFAEYLAVDYADENLVELPESMSATTAAALGCRFVTAFRALFDQGRLSAGEWVAVHGCGGVGLSAVMLAAAAGAHVVAIDLKTEALELARRFGAVQTIDASVATSGGNAAHLESVHECTGGGAHLSLDAFGHPTTCRNSILSLRRRGRHVQVGLLLADQSAPALPMDRVVAWELEILGSHGIQAHRYPELLRIVESGSVDPSALVRRTIALGQAPDALMVMDRCEYSGITVIDRV